MTYQPYPTGSGSNDVAGPAVRPPSGGLAQAQSAMPEPTQSPLPRAPGGAKKYPPPTGRM